MTGDPAADGGCSNNRWRDDVGGKAAFYTVNPSGSANHPLGRTPMRKGIRTRPILGGKTRTDE
jgi:hypothetical protein